MRELKFCLHCTIAMHRILEQPGLAGGILYSPRKLPQEFVCFINPNYQGSQLFPTHLTACCQVQVQHHDCTGQFVFAHDSLKRTFLLPEDKADREIWSRQNHMFANYPYTVPAWMNAWVLAAARLPMDCCPRALDLPIAVLTQAANLNLRTCSAARCLYWFDQENQRWPSTRKELNAFARQSRETKIGTACGLEQIRSFQPTARFLLLQSSLPCEHCGQRFTLGRRCVLLPCRHYYHADIYCCFGMQGPDSSYAATKCSVCTPAAPAPARAQAQAQAQEPLQQEARAHARPSKKRRTSSCSIDPSLADVATTLASLTDRPGRVTFGQGRFCKRQQIDRLDLLSRAGDSDSRDSRDSSK